jgi:hypothetical protein
VRTDTEQETEMDTECSDIGTSFTRDPEDTQVSLVVVFEHLGFVDRSDTQLTLDGGDQGRSLEQGTCQGLQCTGETLFSIGYGLMESNDTDVFLSCALLGLDESGSSVDTDDQASGDLGIQGTRVTSLFTSKDSSEPGDDFVRGRVGRLVQVDDTGPERAG